MLSPHGGRDLAISATGNCSGKTWYELLRVPAGFLRSSRILHLELKTGSYNRREVVLGALLTYGLHSLVSSNARTYHVFRFGDAVAIRNIHAAIRDSIKLCNKTYSHPGYRCGNWTNRT